MSYWLIFFFIDFGLRFSPKIAFNTLFFLIWDCIKDVFWNFLKIIKNRMLLATKKSGLYTWPSFSPNILYQKRLKFSSSCETGGRKIVTLHSYPFFLLFVCCMFSWTSSPSSFPVPLLDIRQIWPSLNLLFQSAYSFFYPTIENNRIVESNEETSVFFKVTHSSQWPVNRV